MPKVMKKGIYVQHEGVFNSDSVRTETWNGRNFTVCPVSMMTEGVHAGSEGPILYNQTELKKWCPSWNHKPITVGHPKNAKGEYVSASSKTVMQNDYVGFLMNTTFNGKQVAEAWLDDLCVDRHCPQLKIKINNHEPVEVSTGLIVDKVEEEGVWNEEKYNGVAVNHRPDHLALLFDTKGACSIADGAGLLVNKEHEKKMKRMKKKTKQMMVACLGMHVSNIEMTFDEIYYQIWDQLRTRFGKPGKACYCSCVLYSDKVIFDKDDGTNQLFLLSYSVADGIATLSPADPVPVERVILYKTADGSLVGNSAGELKEEEKPLSSSGGNSIMSLNRKEALDTLVGNGKMFPESERKSVEAFTDEGLQVLLNMAKTPETRPAPTPEEKKKLKTFDDVLANVDEGLRQNLAELISDRKEEKDGLLKVLNEKTGATADELSKLSIPSLRKMVKALNEKPQAGNGGSGNDFLSSAFAAVAGGSAGSVFAGNSGATQVPVLNTGSWDKEVSKT